VQHPRRDPCPRAGAVPAAPAHHRSQRAADAGHPSADGPRRHGQDASHDAPVRPPPTCSRARHPDLRALAQPGRTLLRHPDAQLRPSRYAMPVRSAATRGRQRVKPERRGPSRRRCPR
jgi:hypothetical protein